MTWLPAWLLVVFVCSITAHPLLQQRELAPSLVLDRINLLRDSIEKLQQMNQRVRCQIQALERPARAKRFAGPAQRLDEMLGALQYGGIPQISEEC